MKAAEVQARTTKIQDTVSVKHIVMKFEQLTTCLTLENLCETGNFNSKMRRFKLCTYNRKRSTYVQIKLIQKIEDSNSFKGGYR